MSITHGLGKGLSELLGERNINDQDEVMINVQIDDIKPGMYQPRKNFDNEALYELADSIKRNGLIQPIIVAKSDSGYVIIAGERRWRACRIAGLREIPVIVKNLHDKEMLEYALIENIQRKDLHPIELMNAYSHLLDKGICTSLQGVADKLGLSKASVVDVMNLKNLPLETQELLLTHQIKSRDFLRILCKAPAENHIALIAKYENKESGDKSQNKKKVINTKTKVLNIVYDNDMFVIENNRVKDLSAKQKEEIKVLIMHVLDLL